MHQIMSQTEFININFTWCNNSSHKPISHKNNWYPTHITATSKGLCLLLQWSCWLASPLCRIFSGGRAFRGNHRCDATACSQWLVGHLYLHVNVFHPSAWLVGQSECLSVCIAEVRCNDWLWHSELNLLLSFACVFLWERRSDDKKGCIYLCLCDTKWLF